MSRRGFVGSAYFEVLRWCGSCKGSVRSVIIVEVLESIDEIGDFFDFVGDFDAGVELVSPCAVASFDAGVEFGGVRRQDVERQVAIGAGLLEVGHELRSAVDLDRFDGVWHFGQNLGEEVGGVARSGPPVWSGDGPFGEGIVGIEVLDDDSGGDGDRERVDLDDVAGLFEGDAAGLANGVRALFRGFAGGRPCG